MCLDEKIGEFFFLILLFYLSLVEKCFILFSYNIDKLGDGFLKLKVCELIVEKYVFHS